MTTNDKQPTSISSQFGDISKVILLLRANREHLLSLWVDKVRCEFDGLESTSDNNIADHMLYIIDALILELESYQIDPARHKSDEDGDMDYKEGEIEDEKEGGSIHGKQRASINAYNADKIFQEYVLLRKIIVEFLQKHHLLDIDAMEIITCVIESCNRHSLKTFTDSVQKVQSKLLSSIIHDIRNPLNTISLSAELISLGIDSSKTSMFSKRIVQNTKRMSMMLEDMLLSLSIEGGQGLNLSFSSQNVGSVLTTIIDEAKLYYGLRIKTEISDMNIDGVFDVNVMSRVIENLISNAFKYGDKKTDVTIRATYTTENILISVHNFGEPIAQERWEDIFLFLRRYEGQDSEQGNSWGIGLAFVKAAIDGHNGKITLKSEEKSGTQFRLSIPFNTHLDGLSKTVSF